MDPIIKVKNGKYITTKKITKKFKIIGSKNNFQFVLKKEMLLKLFSKKLCIVH